jgi:hypothetical protein
MGRKIPSLDILYEVDFYIFHVHFPELPVRKSCTSRNKQCALLELHDYSSILDNEHLNFL